MSVHHKITGNTGNTQGASMLRIPAIKDSMNNNIMWCIYKIINHTMYLIDTKQSKKRFS